MKGEFIFLINGEKKTFLDYREIPEDFDHVIKFSPEIPDEPHSDEQHEEMEKWLPRLLELVEKERARSNKKG